MCGIAGVVGNCVSPTEAAQRMSAALRHRGPDDVGSWHEPGVALAHRRLSIIDLSPAGHQPMATDCGRYTIVYNGEIYNYRELRRELETLGDRFQGNSDTEVLLMAWRRWGARCLPRLNGMWAFAVWDRVERTLHACRDRFGKKPFYYVSRPGWLAFASEIKALFAAHLVVPEVDCVAVADFAAERISDHREGTFFRGVVQLLPGHVLCWREGRTESSPWWTVADLLRGPHAHDAGVPVRALLEDAIRLRLRSDVPVGCLLSGGLDSSAVTAIAARELGDQTPLHVFTSISDPPEDEAAGVGQLAARYRSIVLHEDRPSVEDFWQDLDTCLWHQEEPFADASMVAHFRLMRLARERGVPVLLTGQGADEVMAGYPGFIPMHLGGLLREGKLKEFVGSLREARRGTGAALSSVLVYSLPGSLTAWIRRRRSLRGMDWLIPECRHTSEGLHLVPEYRGGALDAAQMESIRVRTLPGFLHYEDRNSMAFGVETRLPFLDIRLAEHVFGRPASARVRQGRAKALLREAAEQAVPASIVTRTKKTGFPAPLARWLQARAEFPSLAAEAARTCPLLNGPRWSASVSSFLNGDSRELAAVWRGFILARWHERIVARANA